MHRLAPLAFLLAAAVPAGATGVEIRDLRDGEDVFAWVRRHQTDPRGADTTSKVAPANPFDLDLYRRVIGAANEFKEGDAAIGVAAADEASRANARRLLAATRVRDLHHRPLFEDGVEALIAGTTDRASYLKVAAFTLGELKAFVLDRPEAEIKAVMPGLTSDVIACLVKLMSNDELTRLSAKVFNPLPGSKIGAKGYLSARVQPNSPTDNPDDILWQVLDAFAYGVGDALLGTNPVDSTPASVTRVEKVLKDVLDAFGLAGHMPWCVLSHIDVQSEVEAGAPGSTALWFQSLAATDSALKTFDLTVPKMMEYAARRRGPYGLYLETGQGADFTNGHAHGFDMVVHESRNYGFARALARKVSKARAGRPAWLHLNDVSGFIGPEVFRSREQLVRTCLEDLAMGKLHGLAMGLDICSTLHMDLSLEDLDWCQDRIAPANPAYLMALPTKNDPMLSYLTTSYQDHVRLRAANGFKVDDPMQAFFADLRVLDAAGRPGEHFGDPLWVWYRYRKAKGDRRSRRAIEADGKKAMAGVIGRGVPLAVGHGKRPSDLDPALDKEIHALVEDAKACLWTELDDAFVAGIPGAVRLETRSKDRMDYISRPVTGESLSDRSLAVLDKVRAGWTARRPTAQIVVSDGLNAKAITDPGHLAPLLDGLRKELAAKGFAVAPETLVVRNGRVRAGYRIGEVLFGDQGDKTPRAVVHVIGERPGTTHHNYSVYMAAPAGDVWHTRGAVDHDIAKVVSGISDTALAPALAAHQCAELLEKMVARLTQ